MNVVNVIEINNELFFIGKKPEEEILNSMSKYDSRFVSAKVLTGERLKDIRMRLAVTSAAACNYVRA